MIEALRRLLRRKRRLRTPLAANLSDSLVLAVTRRRGLKAGKVAATERVGRFNVSLHELGPGDAERISNSREPEELLDELIPRLDHDGRAALWEFLLSAALPYLDGPDAPSLGKSLHLVRDRLRGRLPEHPVDFSIPQNAVIDAITRIDDRSFWFIGWTRDDDGTMSNFAALSPEGQRVELLDGAYRFEREDVEESLASVGIRTTERHGFVKYVELPAPSLPNDGWVGEVGNRGRPRFDVLGPPVNRDRLTLRDRLVWEFALDKPGIEDLRRDHAYPALRRLQAEIAKSIEIERAVEFGEPPAAPEVSIVVPIYKRTDLLEHQLAHFWQDPEIQASELIYVLDSPELGESFTELAGKLHELYGVPFQVLRTSQNAGFSVANNLAASRARGRLLLLLNSDVIPAGPGWLGRMSGFYDATQSIGALGPKLLYEDGSIQHAGLYFKRDAATRLWENQHYFKGFTRTLAAANVSRPVPAVTGACLMIERALFENLGGLSEQYVQGGYEDSDLCVRLSEAGRRNWYLADVELYHLEAQSFWIGTRHTNRYNAWLQTELWDQRIGELMADTPAVTDARLTAVG